MNTPYQWAVIGAGPAGIAAVGRLIDQGISPSTILWVDPHFKVGDLGAHWRTVSSNTTVAFFLNYLKASDAFNYKQAPDFEINHLPLTHTCTLSYMVEPLQWVTNTLCQQVNHCQTTIKNLHLMKRVWCLSTDSKEYHAKNVIIATGSVPSILSYPDVHVIPFEIAINHKKLKACLHPEDTFAVFGSSHSAMIIIRHLLDLGVKKVINFYRSPCRYAIEMGDWILFDNTGLKGQTADWTRENIDGVIPSNLFRYSASPSNISQFLPECNQVVYAVGFEPRNNISINGYDSALYNPHVGIIGPGLFGFGIAYPELKADPFGNIEPQVGLWKFMIYLNKALPVWLKYHN